MKKIFLVLFIFSMSSFLQAQSMDEKVIEFEKQRFSKNKRVSLEELSINLKVKMPQENWYGYIIDIKAKVQDKQLDGKDIIFSNGVFVTPDLIDINTGKSLKPLLQPKLNKSYYKKTHLIEGKEDAKHKLVVFSDPLCVFCMDFIPDLIKHTKQNSEDIALYYYDFPLLGIHPASNTLVKAMILARKKGIEDIELKIYKVDWDKYFKERSTDEKLILDSFNKEFKTDFTVKEINSKEILKQIQDDMKMGDEVLVKGTPTIFVNGKKDNTRLKYQTLGMN